MNVSLEDPDYYCYKEQFLQILENIDGLDLKCLTFNQYISILEDKI